MNKYKLTTTYGPGNGGEGFDVEIVFTYSRGAPAQGPSYASGGQPADPDEIELVSVRTTKYALLYPEYMQKALEEWAQDWLLGDGSSAAYEEVVAANEAAREYAAELKADR